MFMLETIRNSFAFRWRQIRTEVTNVENRAWMWFWTTRTLMRVGVLVAAVFLLGSRTLLGGPNQPVPAKLVVLTFDDAVKSHRTFVAPLLKELGFQATFFVTHGWMDDTANFMDWQEIAEIHQMGFEIGNHSWTHPNFANPQTAANMPEELGQVE